MSKNPTPQLSNTQRTHQQTPEDKTTTFQLRTQMVFTFWKSSLTQNHQKNGRIHPNRWGLEVVQVQLFSTEVPANWITSPICHPKMLRHHRDQHCQSQKRESYKSSGLAVCHGGQVWLKLRSFVVQVSLFVQEISQVIFRFLTDIHDFSFLSSSADAINGSSKHNLFGFLGYSKNTNHSNNRQLPSTRSDLLSSFVLSQDLRNHHTSLPVHHISPTKKTC